MKENKEDGPVEKDRETNRHMCFMCHKTSHILNGVRLRGIIHLAANKTEQRMRGDRQWQVKTECTPTILHSAVFYVMRKIITF